MKDKRSFRAIQAQRFLRYSIRKFSVGVASVAIASGLVVLAGVNVQAEEVNANATTLAMVNTAPTVKPTAEKENTKVENKDSKQLVEKVEKANLNSAISRLEVAIEKVASNDKTVSAIESAKSELEKAKALEANEKATQADVDKAAKELNNKAFVIESMSKATAEKKEEKENKENKNQDPRNGQAIPGQGESGFRAASSSGKITGKDVFKDGETIKAVTNAYVDMNADNTKPVGWGFDTTISTSTLKAGSITKIELTNLAELGAGLQERTEIRAADNTVIGKVKSIDYKTTTGNEGDGKKKFTPYWAQRSHRGKSYDQRVTEQPAIANETGTYIYNIEWNDKVKDYPNVSFGASNLSGNGYLAPEISKDTPYTATIKIDGRTVLEHTYTRKGQQPNYKKQGTLVSLLENNKMQYLNNELDIRSDSVVLKTDSDIRYGVGSKFVIKLPNADFTEFKEYTGDPKYVDGLNTVSTIHPNKGDSVTYRPSSRWANVRTNKNNVWILNDGRDSGFTLTPRLISPTELELTVTEGAIQEGSTVSVSLQSLGIEKVVKDKALTSEYSNITYENGLIKKGYVGNDETAATLTASGGESVNGESEDVETKVENGWEVTGDGKVEGEPPTGAVVRAFKDLATGKVIGFESTRYTGKIPLREDSSKDYTNVLGNKYDVSNDRVDLVKNFNGEEYILADLPVKNVKGTLSVTKKRARDLYSEKELKAKGIDESAFVIPVEYDYVKKTKVEEVNRTIKFVYADDVNGLAGKEVFPSQKQTVSYTGSIKLTAEGKAVVNSDRKPVYVDWKGTNGQNTVLPEFVVPKKEGFVASVEKVPVQATTVTDKDYEYVVKYTVSIQKAKTTFVDEKGNPIPGVTDIIEQGDSDTPLTKKAEVEDKIKELQNKGYALLSNTYPENGKFDKDKDIEQVFKVTLKARVVTVLPNQPKTPGDPVDADNPEGPKYPSGLEEKDLNKTVTRTITYVYADGTPVLNEDGTPKIVTQEAKFTREATVNLVTKEVTYGNWSEAKDLEEVKSPVVKGYFADKMAISTTKVTVDSKDITEVVTYKEFGSWIPNIPGQSVNKIKYPNNPDNPTKPGKPTQTLPYVKGFTPKTKDGNPLEPVDPKDPSKGYLVPNIPNDPSQDTVINYVKDTPTPQPEKPVIKVVTRFVDENGKDIILPEDGLKEPKALEGYVFDKTTKDDTGIVFHHYKKVVAVVKQQLPKTGDTAMFVSAAGVVTMGIGALSRPKRKKQ